LDAEGLVEESFVQGEESEDEEDDAVSNPQQVGAGAGGTASALDTFGDLSGVNP